MAKKSEDEMPDFSIAERRAQNGDLDLLRPADMDSLLVNQPEPMVTRWVNTGPNSPTGRFHTVVARLGYRPVAATELANLSGFKKSPEGFVTRGEKGEEVLVKMPARIYRAIQLRKGQDNERRRRSQGAMKQTVAESLAADGNHKAAAYAAKMQLTEFEESATVSETQAGS